MKWNSVVKKRKNSIKVYVLCIALITTVLLSGCSTKLSGTYTNNDGLVKTSLTFEDNTVKGTLAGLSILSIDGTYEIKNNEIIFTYDILGLTKTTLTKSFSKSGENIYIDGTKYTKE